MPSLIIYSCINAPFQLKQEYEVIKELRGLSGFGWDETKKLVTATAEVWDAYLAVSVASMLYVPWDDMCYSLGRIAQPRHSALGRKPSHYMKISGTL